MYRSCVYATISAAYLNVTKIELHVASNAVFNMFPMNEMDLLN